MTLKVILKPGEMSKVFPIHHAQKLIIKNLGNSNCKASATFYPGKKGHDTIDFDHDDIFILDGAFASVSIYWIECSDSEISFEFETV